MTTNDHLAYLTTSGLIKPIDQEAEGEFRFQHALLQDAAYSSLLKSERKRLHQAVGETLERLYSDQLESMAPVLAQHFAEAGDNQRALTYFTLAGDVEVRSSANAEAVIHYRQAITLAQQTPITNEQLLHLYLQQGRAAELSMQYDQAIATYEELEQVGQDRRNPHLELAAMMAQAVIRVTPTPVFDPNYGRQLGERALTLAQSLDDAAGEARALWVLMLQNIFTGQPKEAIFFGERSLTLARQLPDKEQLAFTLNDLHRSYLFTGEIALALTALRESRELWRALDNKPMLSDNLSNASVLYFTRGDFDVALTHAKEASEISRAIKNYWGQAYSSLMISRVYFERGLVDEAVALCQASAASADQAGMLIGQTIARSDLAWMHAELGELDTALTFARDACTRAENVAPTFRAWPYATLSYIELLNGNISEAGAALQEANSSFDNQDIGSPAFIWMAVAEAEFALAQQDFVQVNALLAKTTENFIENNLYTYLPDLYRIRARAALAQGLREQAMEALQAALLIAKKTGSRRSLWHVLSLLSTVDPQPEEAEAYRQKAKIELEHFLSNITSAELQESLQSLPQVRALLYPVG